MFELKYLYLFIEYYKSLDDTMQIEQTKKGNGKNNFLRKTGVGSAFLASMLILTSCGGGGSSQSNNNNPPPQQKAAPVVTFSPQSPIFVNNSDTITGTCANPDPCQIKASDDKTVLATSPPGSEVVTYTTPVFTQPGSNTYYVADMATAKETSATLVVNQQTQSNTTNAIVYAASNYNGKQVIDKETNVGSPGQTETSGAVLSFATLQNGSVAFGQRVTSSTYSLGIVGSNSAPVSISMEPDTMSASAISSLVGIGSSASGQQYNGAIVDMSTGKVTYVPSLPPVSSVTISPDDKYFVFSSTDPTSKGTYVVDNTGAIVTIIPGVSAYASYSPFANELWRSTANSTITVNDATAWTQLASITLNGNKATGYYPGPVRFTNGAGNNDAVVATGSDGSSGYVNVMDAAGKTVTKTIPISSLATPGALRIDSTYAYAMDIAPGTTEQISIWPLNLAEGYVLNNNTAQGVTEILPGQQLAGLDDIKIATAVDANNNKVNYVYVCGGNSTGISVWSWTENNWTQSNADGIGQSINGFCPIAATTQPASQ